MTATSEPDHRANRLLAALPRAAYAALAPHLEIVSLGARQILFESGARLSDVYFPHSGVVCLMASMKEGAAETAAIGREGCAGFEAVLGSETAVNRALVQVRGHASRVSVESLNRVIRSQEAVRKLLLQYVRFFLTQTLQSVACNGLHAVEERCAKWLLMAHDRVDETATFNLTQEFLAEMLGVHRPSVTIVARTLQNAGLIRYSRGVITITDRKGLEEAACECYAIGQRALAEILPAK